MKWFAVALSLAAAGCAASGAFYWYQSSRIPIQPAWHTEPGDANLAIMGWVTGVMQNITSTSKLNKIAAAWTAASAALSALAALAAAFSN